MEKLEDLWSLNENILFTMESKIKNLNYAEHMTLMKENNPQRCLKITALYDSMYQPNA